MLNHMIISVLSISRFLTYSSVLLIIILDNSIERSFSYILPFIITLSRASLILLFSIGLATVEIKLYLPPKNYGFKNDTKL